MVIFANQSTINSIQIVLKLYKTSTSTESNSFILLNRYTAFSSKLSEDLSLAAKIDLIHQI